MKRLRGRRGYCRAGGLTQAARAAEQRPGSLCRIEESTKPVVVAVNGFALGGGCELATSRHYAWPG
jgi:enoyl-CoA hydratase/carnithine racemase